MNLQTLCTDETLELSRTTSPPLSDFSIVTSSANSRSLPTRFHGGAHHFHRLQQAETDKTAVASPSTVD